MKVRQIPFSFLEPFVRQPLSTSFSREIDIRVLRESETPSSSDLEMGEIERRVKGYLVSVVV